MKLENRHLNIAVRIMKEDSPLFGEVGRLIQFVPGRGLVLFDGPMVLFDRPLLNPLDFAEADLEPAETTPWPALWKEVRRLRALIPLALDVGYAKREAEEAQEYSDDRDRHPHCQDKADAERANYEAMLAALNRALEGEG